MFSFSVKGSNSLVIPLRNPLDHSIRLAVDLQSLPDVIVRFHEKKIYRERDIYLIKYLFSRVVIQLKSKQMVKLVMNLHSNQKQLGNGMAGI